MQKLMNRFRYYREKHMTTVVMIGLLLLNVLIVMIGCLVLKLLPENRGMSVGDSFWASLKLLLDPGGFLGTKLSAVATIVTSIIVLCGTITFTGGVVGYVTNIITGMIENSKNGTASIAIDDFSLILNWNPRAMSIILDYVHDARRDNRNEYIIILCEKDKTELESFIKREIKAFRNNHATCNEHDPRIMVRNGNPRSLADLESVNCAGAKAIYIMQIEGDETPDFEVIQTCLAISAANSSSNEGMALIEKEDMQNGECTVLGDVSIVAETSNAKAERMLSDMDIPPLYYGSGIIMEYNVSAISNDFTLGKLFAAISMQPMSSYVFSEILSQAGSEFYEFEMEEDPPLLREEMRTLKNAIPVFDRSIDGKIYSRAYLCGDASSRDAACAADQEKEQRISVRYEMISPKPRKCGGTIILFGYSSKLPFILNGILAANKEYSRMDYKVLLSATESQRSEIERIYEMPAYKGLFVKGPVFIRDGYSVEPLMEQIDGRMNSLVVLSRDDYVGDETDKEVFEVWMGIHHLMRGDDELEKMLCDKLIFEVALPSNAGLLQQTDDSQIVVSSEFSSTFMTQMASGSTLKELLLDMISVKGDSDYEDNDYIDEDICDLQLMSVREFFQTDERIEFLSKTDAVINVYEGTNGEYIPIGVIIDKTCYLFTNGGKESRFIIGNGSTACLHDGYLIGADGESMYVGLDGYDFSKGFYLDPDFQLVLVHHTKETL